MTMINWKTSLAGLCAALAQILPAFGVPDNVAVAISTIAVFALGLVAKDSNVTGGSVKQ